MIPVYSGPLATKAACLKFHIDTLWAKGSEPALAHLYYGALSEIEHRLRHGLTPLGTGIRLFGACGRTRFIDRYYDVLELRDWLAERHQDPAAGRKIYATIEVLSHV